MKIDILQFLFQQDSHSLATWNIEDLRERTKYDQILSLLNSKRIHLLAIQEIKCESICSFSKTGREILHSGSSSSRDHDIGFLISPSFRPHAYHFLAYSPHIYETILIFSIYVPNIIIEDSSEDLSRKE